jgi:hypothetical protein
LRAVSYMVLLTGLLAISAGELFAASGVVRPSDHGSTIMDNVFRCTAAARKQWNS